MKALQLKEACTGLLQSTAPRHLFVAFRTPSLEQPRKRLAVQRAKRKRGDSSGSGRQGNPLYITVEPDGSDLWRLDPVIKMLQEGAVRTHLCSCSAFFSPSSNCKLATLIHSSFACNTQLQHGKYSTVSRWSLTKLALQCSLSQHVTCGI